MTPFPRRLCAGGTALLLGAAGILLPVSAQAVDVDAALLITVERDDAAEVAGLDVVSADEETVTLLGAAETVELIEDRGVEIVEAEEYGDALGGAASRSGRSLAAAPMPERLAGNTYDTFFGGYRTVAAYEQFAADIAEEYPEIAELHDFGDTWLKTQGEGGHDLLAVRITGDVAESPAVDDGQEGKPRFFFTAQTHAREIATSESAWRFATELLDGYGTDAQITALLDSTEVWINFQNNPDSISIVEESLDDPSMPVTPAGDAAPPNTSWAWQRNNQNDTDYIQTGTNRNASQPGIDLNRNWDYQWGGASSSPLPHSTIYRGTAPASEPEVRDMAAFVDGLFGSYEVTPGNPAPDDRMGNYLTVHAYSDFVLYPYSYDPDAEVPNLEAIRAGGFRQSAGNDFATGKPAEILYATSGSDMDYVYGELGVPGYVYEVGTVETGGFFPHFGRSETIYGTVRDSIFFAAESAHAPYTAMLGGLVRNLEANRGEDGAIAITAEATDDSYGQSPLSAPWAPEVTDISAIEVAVGGSWTDPGPTTIIEVDPATTVDIEETIAASAAGIDAEIVHVRARNGSGQFGPWESAFVDAGEAALAEITVTASDMTPEEGDTITLAATGVDQFGGDLGDVTERATFTSSVDTDVIDGNRVTFPSASPHVLTATVDGISGSVTVEVQAASTPTTTPPTSSPTTSTPPEADGSASTASSAPGSGSGSGDASGPGRGDGKPLPRTGSETGLIAGIAALLLAVGAGALIAARRRSTTGD